MDAIKASSLFLTTLNTSSPYPFIFLMFFFIISLSLFSFYFFFLRRKVICNCSICDSFLTSSWRKDFNNLSDWYTHLLQTSPTQTIHIHVINNIVTANPDNVEYMLKTKFHNFPKGKTFSMLLGDLLGKGIFNVDGDLWIFQRKLASLEFGSISIRSYAFETISGLIKSQLLPFLSSNKKVFDLQEVFMDFSFNNICNFSFGLDPFSLQLSLPFSHFAESFDLAAQLSAGRAVESSALVWKMKRFLNIGKEKKLRVAIRVVDILAKEVIRQKKKLGFSSQHDLLSRFMSSIDDEVLLRDIIVSFILAGRDTLASAYTSFFMLVSSHPQVLGKIHDEINLIIPSSQEFATFEQIKDMHYLHAAVYECLRLFPPVHFDSKFPYEDDTLPDGVFVKKNTRLTYHPYAMGRSETLWGEDYLEFKPERWLNNGVFVPQSPFKYPVFQGGVRVCLGKDLSIMEMKIVAVSIFRRFDLEIVEPRNHPKFNPGFTATIKGGLQVLVKDKK